MLIEKLAQDIATKAEEKLQEKTAGAGWAGLGALGLAGAAALAGLSLAKNTKRIQNAIGGAAGNVTQPHQQQALKPKIVNPFVALRNAANRIANSK